MNVIVAEGLYDKEYVEQHGFGFDYFKAEIAARTPEWAYPETGIPPELIRETAREMARHRPATLVHPGRHATWYGDDTQRGRAIALLNALLGGWAARAALFPQHGRARLPQSLVSEVGPRQGRQRDHKVPVLRARMITTGIRDDAHR
jgi:thiosulfate reductase/polysulfide reductase chain A